MNIELYIAQLLYRYQCVTVPGFGAFLTEIQSAQWIEESHSFFPPKKSVCFNANIKTNDGLLANHIANTEKTSYSYAVSAIQHAVLNWKNSLDQNGRITLKDIGDIQLNSEGSLVFKPATQNDYMTSSFGLSSLVSPAIKREVESFIETIEEKEVIVFEPEVSNSRSYLKYAAVFILGLGLTGTIGYPLYQNEMASQKTIVDKAVQKQVETKIQEATFFIKNPLPTVTLSIKDKKVKMSYHVMAGAFRDENNANKILEKLIKSGYNAKRIPLNKSSLYPVIYGSYKTFSEAEQVKREINGKDNPDAWILIESL
ncbi:HU domain-containing protein [Flavobacterium algicola]|uniref:HU domain-containing protein n=1 Tax=Flavobacterium algicola TaxID=556529 RepID=UPI001EFE1F2B|nr:SPOR domain-containing protein [Flavobacterium algicola]MCG9791920.1 SPOR domain-containing protein [Flavobacterium algicola]